MKQMFLKLSLLVAGLIWTVAGANAQAASSTGIAVGPQYDSSHVYVAPADVDAFVKSFLGTFGGTSTKQATVTVTPTPSKTTSQILQTPVGMVSLFGFLTPIPAPFGAERTGYLVTDLDAALVAARKSGAEVVVTAFPDAIGRDAIVRFPGGVMTQLYWHTKAPFYPVTGTVPENRIYVSPDAMAAFLRSFQQFAQARIVSDDAHADGIEIGRKGSSFRRIRLESNFGRMTVLVTDGVLPYPYGRETTGYEVNDLAATLDRAKQFDASILNGPVTSAGRQSVMVVFPGGYVAEIHAVMP